MKEPVNGMNRSQRMIEIPRQLFSRRWIQLPIIALTLTCGTAVGASASSTAEADLSKLVRAVPARFSGQSDLRMRYQDLRSQEKVADSPFISVQRDETSFRKRFDLLWNVDRALRDKQSLNFAEVGFEKVNERTIALKQPKGVLGRPLFNMVAPWTDPRAFESAVPELMNRGFREQDVELMRVYLNKGLPNFNLNSEYRVLAEQMGNTVRNRRQHGEKVARAEFEAFEYQMMWSVENAERQWALGFVNLLDNQRQRILSSVFDEQSEKGIYEIYVTAPDDPDEKQSRVLEALASGEFVKNLDRQVSQRD